MKKFQLFLLVALLFAGASAFTAKKTNDLYIKQGGTYVLQSSVDGSCEPVLENTVCTYEIVDEPVAPIYTTDANFEPRDDHKMWEEDVK